MPTCRRLSLFVALTGLFLGPVPASWAQPNKPPQGDCRRALEVSDFKRYDRIPDDKLYRRELTDAQFRCLVSQLVRTRQKASRDHFLDRLQNRLWEAVRTQLRRLLRAPTTDPVVRARVRYLLAYAFAERLTQFGVNVFYLFLYRRFHDRQPTDESVDTKLTSWQSVEGWFTVNWPLTAWRYKSTSSLTYRTLWNRYRFETRRGAAPSHRVERFQQSLWNFNNLAITKRNARFRVTLDNTLERFFDPLPDQKTFRVTMASSATVNNPWGSGFIGRVSADWEESRYAAPFDPSLNTQATDKLNGQAELSYQRGRVGAVARYDLQRHDVVTAFQDTLTHRHAASALAHIQLPGGFLRLGGGGGVWQERIRLLGEAVATRAEGAEGHADVELEWSPSARFALRFAANGAANKSEGDFTGWYPSWTTSGWARLALPRFAAVLSVAWSGHHRDLEHVQTRHVVSGTLELTVPLSDQINLAVSGNGATTHVLGYQAFDSSSWGAYGELRWRFLRRPDLWLHVSLNYSGTRYRQPDVARDQTNLTPQLVLYGRF